MVRWSVIIAAIRILNWSMPLASLPVLQILQSALTMLGYPAVILFVMIESSGIPFPGETMLLLASFYAAIDHHLQIPIVIACAALGAIAGDNIGYYIGRTGGKAVVERYGRYVFIKPEHLERAEKFFARHGDKTVFFGRFVAVLRAWAAFLAGVNRMHWRTFFIYNAAGGIVWATIYGLLGYYAGRLFHDNFGQLEHLARTISWTAAGIVVAGAIIAYIVYRLRRGRAAKK
ncbi:MAG TPA: DedA family protein [Ktedonobacteraceae bacterium]|nr:DedA family protein [Ktedonobacteraceae bacterium]